MLITPVGWLLACIDFLIRLSLAAASAAGSILGVVEKFGNVSIGNNVPGREV